MKEQNIITKIISDAELKAEETVAEAQRRAAVTVEEAYNSADEYRSKQLEFTAAKNKEALSRREITARLDCNKLLLSAKREVLDSVFDGALAKLCALNGNEYLAFLDKLLVKYSDSGETVVLSEHCPCKTQVNALSVVKERSLKISEMHGNFGGGLMLIGNGCDKNLSFEAIVAAARDEKQAEVAAKLFG